MKLSAAAGLLILASFTPAHAAWSFSNPEPLSAPAGIEFVRRSVGNGVDVHIVTFRAKTHTFAVMDNPEGSYDLGSAAIKRGALAASNGGYFQPDRTPLGLVIRQGVTIHPMERAKLLSGLIVTTADRISLLRPAEFKPSANVREALQAGPFLIDGGRPVAGLNNTRSAARTVVFTDGAGGFGLLICGSVTLAEMAQILASPALVPVGKITRALNLDGGSSTALWVRQEPAPFYSREWKGVRNYLAIVPRNPGT